jgi:hypothetical protein
MVHEIYHEDLDMDQMICKSRRLDRQKTDHTVIMYADGKEIDRIEYKYQN